MPIFFLVHLNYTFPLVVGQEIKSVFIYNTYLWHEEATKQKWKRKAVIFCEFLKYC